MTWTKISDTFTDDPELLALARDDRLLLIEATVYSNRVLSDGHIPKATLRIFTDHPEALKGMGRLTRAGFLEDVSDGWTIANFARHQRTRHQVEHTRETTRRRLDNWRKAKARNAVSNGVGHGVSNALPDPTRPERRGGEAAAVAQARDAALPPMPNALRPFERLGTFAPSRDAFSDYDEWEIVNDRYEITAEIDNGDLVSVTLDVEDESRPWGIDVDALEDTVKTQAPHLESILASVSIYGAHATVGFGGVGPITHRAAQIAEYFERLLKRSAAA